MPDAAIAAFSAAVGAIIATVGSVLVFWLRYRTGLRNDHLRRAFERHLDRYERVFVGARTAQDSLRNYAAISGRVNDRSDPFLYQVLAIGTESAQKYCVSVTWTHNPGMLYLDSKLEKKCLYARDLLLQWLAVRRVQWGDVASIRKDDVFHTVSLGRVRSLKPGEYRELRIETRRLVLKDDDDRRRLDEIDRALSAVIADLKRVMAY